MPSLKGDLVSALFLVVHVRNYNKEVPFIMSTNVVREYNRLQSTEETIPKTWHVALKSLAAQLVGFVKTTSNVCLKPWEVKDVTGFVGKSQNCESASTESTEAGHFPNVTASQRIVTLSNPGKTSKVPVRLCNMSAKIVTLPPKSNICELQEVKLLRSLSIIK